MAGTPCCAAVRCCCRGGCHPDCGDSCKSTHTMMPFPRGRPAYESSTAAITPPPPQPQHTHTNPLTAAACVRTALPRCRPPPPFSPCWARVTSPSPPTSRYVSSSRMPPRRWDYRRSVCTPSPGDQSVDNDAATGGGRTNSVCVCGGGWVIARQQAYSARMCGLRRF